MSKNSEKKEIVRLPVIPQQREKISYSEWQCFKTVCQYRWYLDYSLNKRSKDESLALDFGTTLHSVIGAMYCVKKEDRISINDALLMFDCLLDASLEKLTNLKQLPYGPWQQDEAGNYIQSSAPEAVRKSGKDLIIAAQDVDIFKNSDVLKIEWEIADSLDRDDSSIGFKGFVDIIFLIKDKRGKNVIVIGDIKTCKWGWPFKKFEDPNILAQVRLYKHFFCKQFKIDPKKVRTAYLLFKKEPRKSDKELIQFTQVPSSERDISRTISSMQEDITKMRSGEYEKNRENCVKPWGQCPYFGTIDCPAPESVE